MADKIKIGEVNPFKENEDGTKTFSLRDNPFVQSATPPATPPAAVAVTPASGDGIAIPETFKTIVKPEPLVAGTVAEPATPEPPATPATPEPPANGTPATPGTEPPAEGAEPATPDTPPNDGLSDMYTAAAKKMKLDGILPENMEVPENASPSFVYEALLKETRAKVSADEDKMRKDIQASVVQQLQANGVNENDISYAMAIRGGTDPALLYEHSAYDRYASMSADETDNDAKIEVIKTGLKQLSNLGDDQVKRYVESLVLDGDDAILEEFTNQQGQFKVKHDNFLTQQLQVTEAKNKAAAAAQKANTELIQNIINTQTIGDEQLSPTQTQEFEAALYESNQVVTVDGVNYSATEFEKFNMEMQNDLEKKLLLFKMYKYRGEDLAQMQKRAEQKVEQDWLSRTPSEIIKDKTKNTNTKPNTSKFPIGKTVFGGF